MTSIAYDFPIVYDTELYYYDGSPVRWEATTDTASATATLSTRSATATLTTRLLGTAEVDDG